MANAILNFHFDFPHPSLTVGESNFLQSWMGFHLAAPLVPFQVPRGGPFVSPQGHLFTVAGTLWALVLHVRSSIRLVVCGPPLTGIGSARCT